MSALDVLAQHHPAPEKEVWTQRLGYETIGVLRDYVVTGHDEILMRKTRGPLL